MLAFAYYLLKVIICSSILFSYYWFFLRNKIFHSYNRFYLLATIVLSFTMPMVKFTMWQQTGASKTTVLKMLQVVNNSDVYMDEVITQAQYNHMSKEAIIFWMYVSVCLVLAGIFTKTIFRIYSLKKNNPCQYYNDISLIKTDDKSSPFSFLKNIFWNNNIDINSKNGNRILAHEIAHVREKHSYDKLFVNIVLIVSWCNPVFWFIRRELNMIHEFIADKKAIGDGDTAAFASMILEATYPRHSFELTNNFFYSPIKRRLSMLTKNKNKVSYLSRLLVLPVSFAVFAAFTLKAKPPVSAFFTSKPITVIIDAGHGGKDLGAPGNGSYEKDLNLALVKKIAQLNKNSNLKIILTRETDIYQELKEKTVFANNSNADLFISVHTASTVGNQTPAASGMEIFVSKDIYSNSERSKWLAAALISSFQNNYALAVPKTAQQREKGIMVLQEVKCPAVLVEAGYISNTKDLDYLNSEAGQEQFAKNVLNAITNFANRESLKTMPTK